MTESRRSKPGRWIALIQHNGREAGYLYVINEPIEAGKDIYQHPETTMDLNAEFLTKRELSVKRIAELPV